MFTFLVIVTVLAFVALLLSSGVTPRHSSYSISELERRSKHSALLKDELAREKLLPAVKTLFEMKSAIFLVITVVFLIVTFGWAIGIVGSLFVAIFYKSMARTRRVARVANAVYAKTELRTLAFIRKFSGVFSFFSQTPTKDESKVDSKEEFQELIERSEAALTDIERKVIKNALDFNDKLVSSVMTPKSVIDSIKKGEFLGPLVLDELHSLGHSRLPVINEDLDHVVGILYLHDLLSLDVKRSTTAEKAMDTHVYYIREDQTLEHALAAFLKTHHHMLIVINKQRETVGLLTIEDTIEALLGRQIVDEDDNHADLRLVAEHEGRYNNSPAGRIDV